VRCLRDQRRTFPFPSLLSAAMNAILALHPSNLLAPRYKIELFFRYYPTILEQKFAFARYLLAPRYKIELFARYYPTALKQKFNFAR
jgi:hypothetical protein